MNNEKYPKEQVNFLQAVLDMREAQNRYFSVRTEDNLRIAKLKEQRVDGLLAPYLKAGVIVVKQRLNSNQKNLF